jgi:hypothetical protein
MIQFDVIKLFPDCNRKINPNHVVREVEKRQKWTLTLRDDEVDLSGSGAIGEWKPTAEPRMARACQLHYHERFDEKYPKLPNE